MSRLLTILGCCALLATPSAFAGDRRRRRHREPRDGLLGAARDPHGRPARADGQDGRRLPRRRHADAGRARHPRRGAHQASRRAGRQPRRAGHRHASSTRASSARSASPTPPPPSPPAPRRPGSRPPPASAPRRSRACSGCGRTIPRRTTSSSCCPPTRSPAPRPRTPSPQILRFSGWETQSVEDAAATFELPQLGAWQKRVLNTAVRFVGFPYVWGGTSEKPEAPFGVAGARRLRLLGLRLARLQAAGLPRRRRARLDAQGPHDLPDERRGRRPRSGSASPSSPPATSSSSALRPALQAGLDRPHRDLPRRRLDDPLVGPGRRRDAADRLVPPASSPGPAGRWPKPA